MRCCGSRGGCPAGAVDAAARHQLDRRSDESWVVIGPNGAGKTTLLQVAAAQLIPTEGTAEILGERLEAGRRVGPAHRIGLASAAVADRVPPGEKVIDLVLTASYGDPRPVEGGLRLHRRHPGGGTARRAGLRAPDPAEVRDPVRGRAQAGPDRPCADARPGTAAPRRARRRPGPRRPGGPAAPDLRARRATRRRPPWSWSPTMSRRCRRGSPTRCCCARAGARGRPAGGGVHRAEPVQVLRRAAAGRAPRGPVDGPRRPALRSANR